VRQVRAGQGSALGAAFDAGRLEVRQVGAAGDAAALDDACGDFFQDWMQRHDRSFSMNLRKFYYKISDCERSHRIKLRLEAPENANAPKDL